MKLPIETEANITQVLIDESSPLFSLEWMLIRQFYADRTFGAIISTGLLLGEGKFASHFGH